MASRTTADRTNKPQYRTVKRIRTVRTGRSIIAISHSDPIAPDLAQCAPPQDARPDLTTTLRPPSGRCNGWSRRTSGMKATIEVAGLRKRFGRVQALDGMTFTVPSGQVTGFVGPNGAGKSTTMRVILGLDAADAGTALVGGRPDARLRYPVRQLGPLLDAGALRPSRTARNHLLWLAHSQRLAARRVDTVLEQAGLTGGARRRAGGVSLGMRPRA